MARWVDRRESSKTRRKRRERRDSLPLGLVLIVVLWGWDRRLGSNLSLVGLGSGFGGPLQVDLVHWPTH